MKATMRTQRMIVGVAVVALLAAASTHAQNEIVANPKAVKLRKIWQIEGSQAGGDGVGTAAGGLGDIFGTGFGTWAVQFSAANQVRVYQGSREPLDTQSVQTFGGGYVNGHPVVGDFHGDGKPMFGIWSTKRIVINGSMQVRYYLNLHRIDSNRISDSVAMAWDSWNSDQPDVMLFPSDVLVSDVNNDHIDDLIFTTLGIWTPDTQTYRARILIYLGGPDFQVHTPDAMFVGDEQIGDDHIYAAIGRLDDDSLPDLVTGARYYLGNSQRQWKIKFYRGLPEPPFFSQTPERVMAIESGVMQPNAVINTIDADGDGRLDLLGTGYGGDSAGVYVWRSRTSKDPYARAWDRADADNWLAGNYADGAPQPRYLNDSATHYQMTGIFSSSMLAFSGGPYGPNTSYEAQYNPRSDNLNGGGVFKAGGAMPDVNGDGWDDYIAANFSYAEFGPNQGIAIILAGGPYIPFDTAASSIQEVPIEQHRAGLYLWPNPMHNELNIAWRGDLKHMPKRFAVHDVSGRLVVEGEVEPGRGAALWHCASVAAGSYRIRAFDAEGVMIASATIIKH